MTTQKIKVGLNSRDYALYRRYCENPTLQPLLNALIILLVMVCLFDELKQDAQEHEGLLLETFIGNATLRNGFGKFLRHFKERGINLDVDKYIRPAMTELNKRGGALILDCACPRRKLRL